MKKNSGITLIALIITIIILLILANVTISLTLGENGLFNTARKGTEDYQKAQIKEEIGVKLVEKQISKGKGNIDLTPEEVENVLSQYGDVEKDDDGNITGVRPTGKDYVISIKEIYSGTIGSSETQTGELTWTQVGTVVTCSDGKTYEVGDAVLYDCVSEVRNANSDNVANVKTEGKKYYTSVVSDASNSGYTMYGNPIAQTFELPTSNESSTISWYILGAENGKLILGSNDIKKSGNANYFLVGRTGYENGINELDKISALYGQSEFVEKTECMKVEHINNVTGYDPEHTGLNKNTGAGTDQGKYGKDTITQYNMEVKYGWGDPGSCRVTYTYYLDGAESPTECTSTSTLDSFNYYSEGSWTKILWGDAVPNSEIVSLKNSNYFYYPQTLTGNSSTDAETDVGINATTKGVKTFNALFGSNGRYWLGSRWHSAYTTVRFLWLPLH